MGRGRPQTLFFKSVLPFFLINIRVSLPHSPKHHTRLFLRIILGRLAIFKILSSFIYNHGIFSPNFMSSNRFYYFLRQGYCLLFFIFPDSFFPPKLFILNCSKTTENLGGGESINANSVSTKIHEWSIFYHILMFMNNQGVSCKNHHTSQTDLHLFPAKENSFLHHQSTVIITKTLNLVKYYQIYSSHLNFSAV